SRSPIITEYGPNAPPAMSERSGKERLPPEPAGACAGWARPDARADVLDVFVHAVRAGQGVLQHHELLARIPLVGDEEQAGVEPPEPVTAVGERIAAAEDADAAVAVRVREAHVGVGRKLLQRHRVVLALRAVRVALALRAPEDVLLLLE